MTLTSGMLEILWVCAEISFVVAAVWFLSQAAKLLKYNQDLSTLVKQYQLANALQAKQVKKEIARLQGLLTKTIIDSKVAVKTATKADILAQEAVLRVGALEKSTHKIQFMPLDKIIERGKGLEKKLSGLSNPGNEPFDWFDNGILGEAFNGELNDG